MSAYANEGDVYYGVTGSLITNLSGASGRGQAVANVRALAVGATHAARGRLFRHGLEDDQVEAIRFGSPPLRVTLEPRDNAVYTLRLMAFDLLGTVAQAGTGVRSTGGNVVTPLKSSRTFQFATVPVLSTERMLYMPAAVLAPGQDLSWLWARDGEHLDGVRLEIVSTRPDGQTTPAWMIDTPATVASAYTLTP